MSEVFLGKATLLAELADRFAKSGLGLIGAAHRGWDAFRHERHRLGHETVAICA